MTTPQKNPEWVPTWRKLGKVPDGCMLVAKTLEDLGINVETDFQEVLEKAFEKGLATPTIADLRVFCKETQDKSPETIIALQEINRSGCAVLSVFLDGEEELSLSPATTKIKPSDGVRFLFLTKKDE